jgi:hypothetical protein
MPTQQHSKTQRAAAHPCQQCCFSIAPPAVLAAPAAPAAPAVLAAPAAPTGCCERGGPCQGPLLPVREQRHSALALLQPGTQQAAHSPCWVCKHPACIILLSWHAPNQLKLCHARRTLTCGTAAAGAAAACSKKLVPVETKKSYELVGHTPPTYSDGKASRGLGAGAGAGRRQGQGMGAC